MKISIVTENFLGEKHEYKSHPHVPKNGCTWNIYKIKSKNCVETICTICAIQCSKQTSHVHHALSA